MQKINPALYTPIAIAAAGIIIAIAILVIGHEGSGAAATTDTSDTSAAASTGPSATSTVSAAQVNTYNSPTIGDANAPLTIVYWFDYQCPFCRENEEDNMPTIVSDYVDTGKVRIVFMDFSFLGTDSDTLGHWGRAVWAFDPSKFYQWHKAVYDNQGEENTGWATTAELEKITDTVFTAAQTAQIEQLATQNATTYQNEMNEDKQEGENDGVEGTPALLIGNQMIAGYETLDQVEQVINQQLAAVGK